MNTSVEDRLSRVDRIRTDHPARTTGQRVIEANAQLVSNSPPPQGLDNYRTTSLSTIANLDNQPQGVFSRLLTMPMRSEQRREAAQLMHGTRVALMEHRADAIKRESHAYWQSRSVQLAASMDEYLRQHLSDIQLERMDHIKHSMIKASDSLNASLDQIESSSYPALLKDRLMSHALDLYEQTIERIKDDALVQRHAQMPRNG